MPPAKLIEPITAFGVTLGDKANDEGKALGNRNRDRQLLQMPSTIRERLLIVGGVVVLIVGLALVTWNLLERSEQGLNEIKNVKIASISDPKVNSNVVQRNTADVQVRWECQNHPEVVRLNYQGLPVSDEGLKYMLPLKNVQQLSLSGCDVTDEGMSRLVHLPLVVLSIDGTQIGDTGLIILSKIGTLAVLDLSDTNVTSEGIKSLQGMHLIDLNLTSCKVDDASVKYASHIKSLVKLNFSDTNITEGSLHYLTELPQLIELHLGRVPLTSAGAKQLSQLKQLKSLDVKDTGLTDAALKEICTLPHLNHLDVGSNKITDAGLRYIASAPNLRAATIEGCPGVTERGVNALIKDKPMLEVKHNRPWQDLTGDELIGKFIKKNATNKAQPVMP